MFTFNFIGISHALFIALFFIIKPSKQMRDWLIVVFMAVLCMPLIRQLPFFDWNDLPAIFGLRGYPFLFGPLLYLYARFMISEKPQLKKIDLLHMVPFIVMGIISIYIFDNPEVFHHGPGMQDMQHPPMHEPSMHGSPMHGPPPHQPLSLPVRVFGICTVFSLFAYTIAIFFILQRHKKHIGNYFSFNSISINLKWLQWLTAAFFCSILFVVITASVGPYARGIPLLDPLGSHAVSITFFIIIFGLINMKQPLIFHIDNSGSTKEKQTGDEKDNPKYERSGLKEDEAGQYLNKIKNFMESEKPYHNGDLTIVEISNKLDIPRHFVTQVLNEKLKKNFYTFINEYRVEEIKNLIADKDFKEHSLLRLALDVGFNSKSSFNKIFKEMTSMTPSQYRREHG